MLSFFWDTLAWALQIMIIIMSWYLQHYTCTWILKTLQKSLIFVPVLIIKWPSFKHCLKFLLYCLVHCSTSLLFLITKINNCFATIIYLFHCQIVLVKTTWLTMPVPSCTNIYNLREVWKVLMWPHQPTNFDQYMTRKLYDPQPTECKFV